MDRVGLAQSAATAHALAGAMLTGFLGKLLAALRLGFTVPEQVRNALVQALDDSEKLVDLCGFAGYLLRSQVRDYGFAQLRRAAHALRCKQREHRLGIALL